MIFLAYSVGIVACIYFISGENLTARESGMIAIILTILSILASWSFSHYYSESQHTKALKDVQEFHRTNLKTYARKAAEKVNNLSNELSRLSAYLEKELTRADYDSSEEELNAKEERIESAIHITNTLKSINDTSLSDWEGVIGDELEERRAEQQEREEELEELLARYESTISSLEMDVRSRGDNTLVIQKEIESLKSELRFLSSRVGIIMPPILRPARSSRNVVETRCPVCQKVLTYKQKPKETGIKALRCTSCGSNLVSRYNKDAGFRLELRQPIKERVSCPNCSLSVEAELDQVPSTTVKVECSNCGAKLRIVRIVDGLRVTQTGPPMQVSVENVAPKLDEQLIERVRDELPKQPWPKGIHKIIATKLTLTHAVVYSAISELIRQGVFNPQIDGKLYILAPPAQEEDRK
jgi:ssDNA-binding Zn-finger/Zn-ribbon topoisomerase 1/Tfp pilus assembly protein PilE